MNILPVAINAKYIHTNPAIAGLRAYAATKGIFVNIKEYTIAQESMRICGDIAKENPDIVLFSCYIWNSEKVLEVSDILKKAFPQLQILIGGPEMGYQPEKALERYPFIDGVVQGEGEEKFVDLCIRGTASHYLFTRTNKSPQNAKAICMDDLPFAYTDEELSSGERIFYYESSRGCPFGCTYCLSGAEKGVRYKSIAKVCEDIRCFMHARVRLVKFVDRTFNADSKRAAQILEFIASQQSETIFHFEICAELITPAFAKAAGKMPRGALRLEAGLQSCNPEALAAVNRSLDYEKFARGMMLIRENSDAIVHLDLLAGLPMEDYTSFGNAINTAYALEPHELQIGFLKLLSGTEIEKNKDTFGYKCASSPPYEVICNDYIDFQALRKLKNVERVIEIYHNSKGFVHCLPFIMAKRKPFDFFEDMADFFEQKGFLQADTQRSERFLQIYAYAEHKKMDMQPLIMHMAKDFLLTLRGATLPKWAAGSRDDIDYKKAYELLELPQVAKALSLCEEDKSNWHKNVRLVGVQNEIWLIDYYHKKIVDVTNYF